MVLRVMPRHRKHHWLHWRTSLQHCGPARRISTESYAGPSRPKFMLSAVARLADFHLPPARTLPCSPPRLPLPPSWAPPPSLFLPRRGPGRRLSLPHSSLRLWLSAVCFLKNEGKNERDGLEGLFGEVEIMAKDRRKCNDLWRRLGGMI